eukprot:11838875-Alexandrium_andersonii.AAC.1
MARVRRWRWAPRERSEDAAVGPRQEGPIGKWSWQGKLLAPSARPWRSARFRTGGCETGCGHAGYRKAGGRPQGGDE